MKDLIYLFKYLNKYKGKVAVSLLLLLFSVGLNLMQPKFAQWVINEGVSSGNMGLVLLLSVAALAAAILGAVANYISGRFLINSAQYMSYDLRNDLYKKMTSLSFANLDKWRTGELMVRLNSDVNTVRMFVRMGLLMMIQSLLMIIGSLAAMFSTDVHLASIMAIIMPATLALFFILVSFIRPVFIKIRKYLDSLNNVLQENLAGAKLVRALSRQKEEKRKFSLENNNFTKTSIKVGVTIGIVLPFLMLIGNGAVLATLWSGGNAVVSETGLNLGELVAFINYAMMAMFPIIILGMVLSFITMASASATRIKELLDEKSLLKEKTGALSKDKLNGEIEFKNVSFSYGEGEKTLDRLNLKIKPGETFGIIGTTGSGKTSFVNLIPRFYDPGEGQVLIDGTDARDYSLRTLRTRIGTALQESVLFSGTIAENIAFAFPEASRDDIEKAAKSACAHDFITGKEKGYDEKIGQRGLGLSGGQRQRVAIARSLASKPDILILDDVTSSLDLETEQKIVGNLYNYKEVSTKIIISQKIRTVQNADRIMVMDKGKIIGLGTHQELLNNCPMYKEIEETQNLHV